MTSFVQKLINDDFLWDAIVRALPQKRRSSGTRFININCPMCMSRGETPDTKSRCGVKHSDKGVGVHCFNCGFKALWRPGDLVSYAMRDFLIGLGVDELEVKRLNHKALSYREMLGKSPEAMALLPASLIPHFPPKDLPAGTKDIAVWAAEGCDDPDFLSVASYLLSRGDEIACAMSYGWTPETELRRRVIIPCEHEGQIVGWIGRSCDADSRQRYYNSVPGHFLFNSRILTDPNRQIVVLVEGVFDAIAIDGLGTLGARLADEQAAWIKASGKRIILVPDRDRRGLQTIDTALKHGWEVAMPAIGHGHGQANLWEDDVKDCAEAVKRYGSIWTVQSILATATDNPLKIELMRRIASASGTNE